MCASSAPCTVHHLLLPAGSLPPTALWLSFLKTLVGLNFPLDLLSSFSCCFCKSAGRRRRVLATEMRPHLIERRRSSTDLCSLSWLRKVYPRPFPWWHTERNLPLRETKTPTGMQCNAVVAFTNLCMSRSRLLMIRFLWSMMDTSSFSSCCSLSRSSWVQSHSSVWRDDSGD